MTVVSCERVGNFEREDKRETRLVVEANVVFDCEEKRGVRSVSELTRVD